MPLKASFSGSYEIQRTFVVYIKGFAVETEHMLTTNILTTAIWWPVTNLHIICFVQKILTVTIKTQSIAYKIICPQLAKMTLMLPRCEQLPCKHN